VVIENNAATYTVSMVNKSVTVDARDINSLDDFLYWDVWNINANSGAGGWNTLVGSNVILNIAVVLTEAFIEAYAYDDGGVMKIRFNAIFVDTTIAIYRLTVKSNQQGFGEVKFEDNPFPIPYNEANPFPDGTSITIIAEAFPYYKFNEFSANNDTPLVIDENSVTLTLTKDTIIYVAFEREKYQILISSKYVNGSVIAPSVGLESVSNDGEFKIGDVILITYKTNVAGYRFSSLKYAASGAELERSGFGMFYLEMTKGLLDRYLEGDGKLRLVVEYFEEYAFLIEFSDPVMEEYCEIIKVYSSSRNIYLGSTYYINADAIIEFELLEGYEILSIEGLNSSEIEELLLNGELTVAASEKHIIISIVPKKYIISLNAKWGDELIDEIKFSTGKEFEIEYNGETDTIEKFDIPRYKFEGWFIYNWDNSQWVGIRPTSVKQNGNLEPLEYVYLKSYINNLDNIEIVASYVPVYTLAIVATGQWPYKVEFNNKELDITSGHQFDHNDTVKISFQASEYVSFNVKLGADAAPQVLTKNSDGYYDLTLKFTSDDYTVYLNFDLLVQTFNIVEKLAGAKGELGLSTTGIKAGNQLKVDTKDTVTFAFDIKSGQKLRGWTINGKTIDEIAKEEYAAYSEDNLTLTLRLNDDALKWLLTNSNAGAIDITINTMFNPLLTIVIVVGSILIVALVTLIGLYIVAAGKKKRKIQAAERAGIIGAARFKTNFEDFKND